MDQNTSNEVLCLIWLMPYLTFGIQDILSGKLDYVWMYCSLLGRFFIFMVSLNILFILCSRLAIILLFSISIVRDVTFTCTCYDETSSFLADLWRSCIDSSVGLLYVGLMAWNFVAFLGRCSFLYWFRHRWFFLPYVAGGSVFEISISSFWLCEFLGTCDRVFTKFLELSLENYGVIWC